MIRRPPKSPPFPYPPLFRSGYEPLIQAYSGLSSLNGGPDDPPMRGAASVCDQGSGMWAVIGALSLRSEEHTSELQSPDHLVSRLLLEKKNNHHLSHHETHHV